MMRTTRDYVFEADAAVRQRTWMQRRMLDQAAVHAHVQKQIEFDVVAYRMKNALRFFLDGLPDIARRLDAAAIDRLAAGFARDVLAAAAP